MHGTRKSCAFARNVHPHIVTTQPSDCKLANQYQPADINTLTSSRGLDYDPRTSMYGGHAGDTDTEGCTVM
jgi:hypothetical protein